MLTLPKPRRTTIHATCNDGFSGIVSYVVERPDGSLLGAPKKIPTYALIAMLAHNYRASEGLPRPSPTHWDALSKKHVSEKENRRDPHVVRREEMDQIRKASQKGLDS